MENSTKQPKFEVRFVTVEYSGAELLAILVEDQVILEWSTDRLWHFFEHNHHNQASWEHVINDENITGLVVHVSNPYLTFTK